MWKLRESKVAYFDHENYCGVSLQLEKLDHEPFRFAIRNKYPERPCGTPHQAAAFLRSLADSLETYFTAEGELTEAGEAYHARSLERREG